MPILDENNKKLLENKISEIMFEPISNARTLFNNLSNQEVIPEGIVNYHFQHDYESNTTYISRIISHKNKELAKCSVVVK